MLALCDWNQGAVIKMMCYPGSEYSLALGPLANVMRDARVSLGDGNGLGCVCITRDGTGSFVSPTGATWHALCFERSLLLLEQSGRTLASRQEGPGLTVARAAPAPALGRLGVSLVGGPSPVPSGLALHVVQSEGSSSMTRVCTDAASGLTLTCAVPVGGQGLTLTLTL